MSTPTTPDKGGAGAAKDAAPKTTTQVKRPEAPENVKKPAARPEPSGSESRPSARPAPQRPSGVQQRPAGAATRPTPSATASPGPSQAAREGRPAPSDNQDRLVRPAPKAKVRKARLLVSKVEPFSVLKLAFLLSVGLGILTVVAAVMFWAVLDLAGTFNSFNSLMREAMGAESNFDLRRVLTLGQVASYATILAVVNVVVISVVAMLGTVLYNIAASLVGGIGVTLTDD